MEIFVYFFLGFILLAVVIAFLTKKPFVFCLGNMFLLAAVVIIVWSFIIDDGSRRGMEALVLAIMWGMAAGSFLIGLILRKIGAPQSRNDVSADQDAIKTDAPEQ